MKKLDFELRTAATSTASGSALENAHRVMEEHKDVLHTSGVVGTWIGAVASQAYIRVALNQGNSERLRKMIPDCCIVIRVADHRRLQEIPILFAVPLFPCQEGVARNQDERWVQGA